MHPPTASSVQGYIPVFSTDQTCNGYHYKSRELPEPRASSYTKSWWTAKWDFKADSVAYTTVWLETPCVMLGRFHLEMGALCWPCKWLTDKGRTASIVHSQLYTYDSADTLLKVAHMAKTKHAHPMIFCALNILLQNPYHDYIRKEAIWQWGGNPKICHFCHPWLQTMELKGRVLT